jgi:acetyl/propionyl-CoA carboxylase alpha subunit
LLAAGELKLPAIPERVGSAIEVRLYAEDPFTFLPAPGPLGEIRLPTGAFVRSDSAFSEAGEVSLNYDPMISKISVWGATRAEAVERLRAALDEARVQPPKRASGERVGSLRTNLSFLRRLARDARVIAGDTTTDLIAKTPALVEPFSTEPSLEAAIATSLFQILSENVGVLAGEGGTAPESVWAQRARLQSLRGGG